MAASADMHRQRLRHLISSSVHELWKKETGSVTSVLIEGTICITVHGGRTTVVQLSDKYPGLLPEPNSASSVDDDSDGRIKATENTAYQSYAISPSKSGLVVDRASAVSGSRESGKMTSSIAARAVDKDSNNNNQTSVMYAEDMTLDNDGEARSLVMSTQGKPEVNANDEDDELGEDIEVDDEDEDVESRSVMSSCDEEQTESERRHRSAAISGAGADDSAIHDMSLFDRSSANATPHMMMSANETTKSTAVQDLRSPMSVGRRLQPESLTTSKPAAVPTASGVAHQYDVASSSSSDMLMLSSPQDLTAQVRNVIRQRLMASKQLSPFEALHQGVVAAAAAAAGTSSPSFARQHNSSPYYRSMTSPHHWSTPMHPTSKQHPGSGDASAVTAAARRLMSSAFPTPTSVSGSPLSHHHPLLSPPSSGPLGLPVSASPSAAAAAAIQFGASLHNLLGMQAAAVAARAAAVAAASSTANGLDLKMHGSATSSPPAAADLPASMSGTPEHTASSSTGADLSASGSASGSSAAGGADQKIYRCDYCFKTFLFKSKYHEHLPVHTSARPFQCHLCTRTYKYKYDLRVHLRTHLGIPTKSTVCPFCAGRFATNKLLRQHMRSAHSDDQAVPLSKPDVAMTTASPRGSVDLLPPLASDGAGSSSDDSASSEMTSPELVIKPEMAQPGDDVMRDVKLANSVTATTVDVMS